MLRTEGFDQATLNAASDYLLERCHRKWSLTNCVLVNYHELEKTHG